MAISRFHDSITPSEAKQIFDGVMLSDGGLIPSSGAGVNSAFQIQLSGNKHVDWLMQIHDALEVLKVHCMLPKSYFMKSKGRFFTGYRLGSKVSPFIASERLRWYPGGVKRIPKDLKLTPISLASEFMGDGNSSYNHSNPENGVIVKLSTMSYDLASIELMERLLRKLGIAHLSRIIYLNCSGAKGSSKIGINILGASVEQFMSLVEPYIVPSFRYKIKRPGNKAHHSS